MFAHGNSRMELLVTGTLHPPPPPRAGMEERKSNLIPRPSSPSLSRKIKSSFNPRDPKQGGGGKGGGKQEQRTSSITGGEKKKSRRSSSGEHAVSAIDYAEMKFHPATIPPPSPPSHFQLLLLLLFFLLVRPRSTFSNCRLSKIPRIVTE